MNNSDHVDNPHVKTAACSRRLSSNWQPVDLSRCSTTYVSSMVCQRKFDKTSTDDEMEALSNEMHSGITLKLFKDAKAGPPGVQQLCSRIDCNCADAS